MENNKYEIQNKILNIDDINLSSRIFLYFLVSKFVDTRDNNIEIKFEEIRAIIGYGNELTLEIIMNLKLKDYIKSQKDNEKIMTLSTKTLTLVDMLKMA